MTALSPSALPLLQGLDPHRVSQIRKARRADVRTDRLTPVAPSLGAISTG